MKIRPVGAELFHAGERAVGQTDMTKLTVAFCNSANAPKKVCLHRDAWLDRQHNWRNREYGSLYGKIK
jgi:hypothetical protein